MPKTARRSQQLGAALPEDLAEIDDETLDSFGMAPLERKRFYRVVKKAFPPESERRPVVSRTATLM